MGDTTLNYGSNNQAITITLDTPLTNTSMRESTAVSNATNKFIDVLVGGTIGVATGATVGNTITIFVYGTVDGGTFYSGQATGTDAAYTGSDEQLFVLGVITMDSAVAKVYEFGPFSVAAAFGGTVPDNWGIVVLNNTGVSLSSTASEHDINYQGVKGTTA